MFTGSSLRGTPDAAFVFFNMNSISFVYRLFWSYTLAKPND